VKNKLVTNETLCQKIEELRQDLCRKEVPLTYKQYADQFGYEVSTVRKKASKGEIPVKKLAGKPVIYLSEMR